MLESATEHPKPLVKWAGGKGQLIQQFEPLLPKQVFGVYHEPFLGGGAVFFHLLPEKAVLIDNNLELINFYLVVRDTPEALLESLKKHRNDEDYYYHIRAMNPNAMDSVSRASRFLYLNKTGYNGLWRVNKQGEYNVPFGRYKSPKMVDAENIFRVSYVLKRATILLGDFSEVIRFANQGDFVYFDPPYHPVSKTASFTDYTSDSFGEGDHKRLSEVFRLLDRMGCLVMLSNSDTPFIRSMFRGYDIRTVQAKRMINSRADRRGPVTELVIRNYF